MQIYPKEEGEIEEVEVMIIPPDKLIKPKQDDKDVMLSRVKNGSFVIFFYIDIYLHQVYNVMLLAHNFVLSK